MLIRQLREHGFHVLEHRNCDNIYIAKVWLHGEYITTISARDYYGEWSTEIHNQKVNLEYFTKK